MSENPTQSKEISSLVIPAFKGSQERVLSLTHTISAEKRIHEAKMVNTATYADLEHAYGEGYRELRANMASVGFEIAKADKDLRMVRAEIILDKYPAFMEGKPKSQDNADMRESFVMRDADYQAALDRLNALKAMEEYMKGKISILENVSRWMKKQMDLVIKSGIDPNLYNRR